MGELILQDILIIFLFSIPVVILFQQLRLPSILGFLVTGALIGPEGIALITDKTQIDTLAELGVALLLFSVGLEFSFEGFGRSKRKTFLAGFLQISVTILAGMFIGKLFGWTLYNGIYVGCLLALSSTAVVITTLYDRRMLDSIPGQISTAILILQDLAFIPMMVLLPLFGLEVGSGIGGSSDAWRALALEAGKALLLITVVTLLVRFIAGRILRQISRTRSRELFVITITAIALGMAWLTDTLGLSFALGAFLGGIMIGLTDYKYQALSDISPFRYCFNSLFFCFDWDVAELYLYRK